MDFETLRKRLILQVRERVRSGELTERGLAKATGMSQPHIHNVLKGVRSLSFEYADRILGYLQLSTADLLENGAWGETSRVAGGDATVNVPWLRGSAGPACILQERPYPGDFLPLSQTIIADLQHPILVTLGHDPLLHPFFQEGDIVLVTRQPVTASNLDASALYLVKSANGSLVRSLRLAGTRLYLIASSTKNEPRTWGELPLLGRPVGDLVLGRLVGLARRVPGLS